MNRQADLLSMLPLFVQEYREIRHIMAAQLPEIQTLDDETEIIKNNQFILSCDLVGITRFEKLLGITPNPDDNLYARISRVIIRWNDSIPYTYRALMRKLVLLCGEGNFTLLPNFNEYELEIVASLSLSGQVEEFEHLLSYMIPANIKVISTNSISRTVGGTAYLGGTTVRTRQVTISSADILID